MREERISVLIGELDTGDIIIGPRVFAGTKVLRTLPKDSDTTIVLGTNGRWFDENNRLTVTIVKTVTEWDDFTPEVMGRLDNEFAPGFQLDEEFVKPLWLNACSCIEVQHEDNGDEEPKPTDEELTRQAYVRVESALHVLFYGTTPDGTWVVS